MQRVKLIENMLQDIHFGLRILLKNRGFAVTAVLTMALGIGANTAVFTMINALLFPSLPYPHPEQLVALEDAPAAVASSQVVSAGLLNWAPQLHSFQSIAAYQPDSLGVNLSGGEQPVHLSQAFVSPNFFPTLGVPLVVGSGFGTDFDRASRVVILSWGLWQRQFGADQHIIGRVISLNELPYTVVGVAPRDFSFPSETEVWTPLEFTSGPGVAFIGMSVIGRLQTGVGLAQAQAEMRAFSESLWKLGEHRRRFVEVVPLAGLDAAAIRNTLMILFGAAGMVLVVACANVANLNFSRMVTRQRELAVRIMLGASRARLLGQLVTESTLIAMAGGAAGLVAAFWGVGVFKKLGSAVLPHAASIHPDGRVFAFALGLSALSGIVSGLLPALRAIRHDPEASLKEGGSAPSTGLRHTRLAEILVITEIALALPLIVGTGLLVRSLARVLEVSPGYNAEHVLTASIWPCGPFYGTGDHQTQFFYQLLGRLASVPGVEAAGATGFLPLKESGAALRFSVSQEPSGAMSREDLPLFSTVTPDYFKAMGIHLLSGRGFAMSDTQAIAQRTVLVSRAFAQRFWPDGNGIGQYIEIDKAQWEVVGIVADVKPFGLEQTRGAKQVYFPYPRGSLSPTALVVRSHLDPTFLAWTIKKAVAALDPNMSIYDVRTMNDRLSDSTASRRLTLLLLGAMTGIALLLGAVGISGITSGAVTARAREIGIRMALGAQLSQVIRLIVTHSLRRVLLGIAMGAVSALALTHVLTKLLFEVRANDPATFIAAAMILGAVALISAYIPARRIAHIDPATTVRCE